VPASGAVGDAAEALTGVIAEGPSPDSVLAVELVGGRSAGCCAGAPVRGLDAFLVGGDLGVHPGLVGRALGRPQVRVRDGRSDQGVVQVPEGVARVGLRR
jgi:hypothetical protein